MWYSPVRPYPRAHGHIAKYTASAPHEVQVCIYRPG